MHHPLAERNKRLLRAHFQIYIELADDLDKCVF